MTYIFNIIFSVSVMDVFPYFFPISFVAVIKTHVKLIVFQNIINVKQNICF